MMPTVSIAICTRNRPAELALCLRSIAALKGGADEVIVVDNASDGDATKKLAGSYGARYVLEPQIGIQFARNRALTEAVGDIIAFADDDCEVDNGWIDAIVRAFSDPLVGAVTGKAVCGNNANWVQRQFDDYSRGFCRPEPVEAVPETAGGIYYRAVVGVGANMAFRRTVLVAQGGVPGACRHCEDDYMLASVVRAGYKVRYTPESVVYQKHRSRMPQTVARMFEYGRGVMRVLWLMSAEDESFLLFALNVCWVLYRSELRGLLRSFVRLRPWHTLFCMASLAGFFSGLFIPWGWRAHLTGRLPSRGGIDQDGHGRRGALAVLMYHRVGPALQGTYETLTIGPDSFKKQMDWLMMNGYDAIGVDGLLAWRAGAVLPQKAVLLTFDDAYADLVEYAFPVLLEKGFTALVFPVTGEIGGGNSWDAGHSAPIACMSAEQIRRWAAMGIEFGAHSRTHADLAALPDAAVKDEITGSGRDLAEILGKFPRSFAYPYGSYSASTLDFAARVFDVAFTCEEGLNDPLTEPHLMRRTMVRPRDTLLEFGMRVKYGFNPLLGIRDSIRLRTRLRAVLRLLGGR